MFGIIIITNKELEKKLKEAHENGIRLRTYVDGLGNKTVITGSKVAEQVREIQKSKVQY